MSEVQVTTDEVGCVIADALNMIESKIDTAATGDDAGFYILEISREDTSNLKVMLSNGQVFTVRIIAGDH